MFCPNSSQSCSMVSPYSYKSSSIVSPNSSQSCSMAGLTPPTYIRADIQGCDRTDTTRHQILTAGPSFRGTRIVEYGDENGVAPIQVSPSISPHLLRRRTARRQRPECFRIEMEERMRRTQPPLPSPPPPRLQGFRRNLDKKGSRPGPA
uniref:Uncharacterized protein n=1 Tax=Knipowitschia caucasica TaxID=637954 RepID=A0AAV2L9N2_KNICA